MGIAWQRKANNVLPLACWRAYHRHAAAHLSRGIVSPLSSRVHLLPAAQTSSLVPSVYEVTLTAAQLRQAWLWDAVSAFKIGVPDLAAPISCLGGYHQVLDLGGLASAGLECHGGFAWWL